MRAVLIVVLAAVCGSAWPAPPARVARPGCASPGSQGCSVEETGAASETVLRAAGPLMAVSCGARWKETPLDADEMRRCADDMRRLAASLSDTWAGKLEPIDPGLIRYDWAKVSGCDDFIDDDGRGWGICPAHGEAHLPMSWRSRDLTAPPR